MHRTSRVVILVVALAALAAGSRAEAGLIPTNVSVTPDGSNFRWTYAVVVTTDVKVNSGDYFTIYDFGALVNNDLSTVVAPTGWNISMTGTGPTPGGTNPADDPGVPNITFTFNGSVAIEGQAGLGNFSAISEFGNSTDSDFTSITHRQVDGRAEANITSTDVPIPRPGQVQSTPEPATLAMFGLGLPFAGLGNWLRRRLGKK